MCCPRKVLVMQTKKQQLISLAVVIGLLSITTYFLFRDREISNLVQALANVNLSYIFMGSGAVAAFFAMEALAIKLLLGSLSYPTTFRRCYSYSLVDFYFSAITPGCCGGQPSQIFFMHRDKIPVGVSSLSLLVFNNTYHVAVLLIAGTSLLIAGGQVFASLGLFQYLLYYGAGAQLLLVALFSALIFSPRLVPKVLLGIVRGLAKIKIIRNLEKAEARVSAQISRYREGADYIRKNPFLLLKVLGVSILHLLLLYCLPYFVYRAFGGSELSIVQIIALQAILTISVESLPIPGGFGVMEGGFMVLYGSIFGAENVVAAVLLCRGLNYYLGLVSGGIVAACLSRTKKQQRQPRLVKPMQAASYRFRKYPSPS